MSTPESLLLRRHRAAGAAVAALVVSNVVTNRRLPLAAHVPWSLGITSGLIAVARWAGSSLDDIGLDPAHLRRGARVGAAGAAVVAAGYGAMVATGTGSDLFRDRRVTSLGWRDALWHLVMRIPLCTVVAEEVAFRGVLPALFRSSPRSKLMPGAAASLLFGIWHLLPSLAGSRANRPGTRGSSRTAAMEIGVTALAGGLLHVARRRSRHLAAPMAIHMAANTVGFLVTRWVGRVR